MLKVMPLDHVQDYVSKYDDGDPPTTFRLGVLSSRDVGRIRDMAASFTVPTDGEAAEVTTHVDRSKMAFEVVSLGLKGWENLCDADGNEIPFKTKRRHSFSTGKPIEVVDPDLLDRLPLPVIEELADEIMSANTVDEEDVKN